MSFEQVIIYVDVYLLEFHKKNTPLYSKIYHELT